MKMIDLPQAITITANVGVIASIVFLGVEVNQNNRLLESETRASQMMFRVNVNQRYADDGELMELRMKANRKENLSEVEEQRLLQDARSVFAYWEWQVESYQKGELEQFSVNGMKGAMDQYAHLRSAWRASKEYYTPEFVAFMDENVATP